jgi:hypothetical protein
MFAIIQNNQIVKTGSIKSLFPNVSFPAGGASAQFKADNGVVEVVSGEQKDQRFYWVTPANPHLQLVDGVPTFMFTNTPKELEDREEVDEDGNPMYVKVLGEVDGEPAMVDSDGATGYERSEVTVHRPSKRLCQQSTCRNRLVCD